MALKVLVVDDHALIRQGMRSVLAQLGDGEAVEVIEAAGYGEALERIAANPDLDLVLLDLRMPDVSGFAALADIEDRHPEVPIVVMTGEDDPELVREAFEHGALASFPSPLRRDTRRLAVGFRAAPRSAVDHCARATPRVAPAPAPGGSRCRLAADRLGITRASPTCSRLLAGKSTN